jgi:hypothetical protein
MDAVKFLQERNRMFLSGWATPSIGLEDDFDPVMAVEIVEKWSKQHPRKTRQSVFLEQYPETQIDDNGVLGVCPAPIFHSHRTDGGRCIDINRKCTDCRREFWMQEVE